MTHCARPATSQHQRITMVTSYVPADARLPDNSILSPLLRQASNQPLLFAQWSEYRLQTVASKAASIAQVPDCCTCAMLTAQASSFAEGVIAFTWQGIQDCSRGLQMSTVC